MSAFGQFANGPIQFNDGNIVSRGTVPPSVVNPTPTPSPSPTGGGVLPGPSTGPNPTWGLGGGPYLPASNNGGSYGLGGGGSGASFSPEGPGGFDQTTGTAFFDDGGVVQGDNDPDGGTDADGDYDGDVDDPAQQDGTSPMQGAAAATMGPMQAVMQALYYGRQKFNLPQNFTAGPQPAQQGFDDGGVVTAGGNTQGPAPVDPRQALMYLTGTGNVSPDIANALEMRVDPQGQMAPAQRTLASIAAAPSPDARFGMLQHYRTKYNAYSAGARAALDQGNVAQAAANATKAMANVPTGYNVQFAPARGGIAMVSSKMGGGKPTQAFDDGGKVERDKYADFPEDGNIEDRRDETPEGADNEPGAADGYVQSLRKKQTGGGFFSTPAYADGGEVDTDDEGADPGYEDDMPAAPEQDYGADPGYEGENGGVLPSEQPAQPDHDQGGDQGRDRAPVILSPDQFKNLMQSGFDKPIDDGWQQFASSILNAINPVGTAQAADLQPGRGAPTPAQSVTDMGSPASVTAPWGSQNTMQPRGADTDNLPAMFGQLPHSPPPADVQQAAQGATTRQSSTVPDADQRMEQYEKRFEALANKLYPSVGQMDQRNAFINQMMQKVVGNQLGIESEAAKGKAELEKLRQQGRMQQELFKQTNLNARNANSVGARERIAAGNRVLQAMNASMRERVRLLGQQLVADPSLAADPQQAMARVTQMAQVMGIRPNDLLSAVQAQRQQGQQGQQQQGAPQQPMQNPQPSAIAPGTKRPYTKNGVTKTYVFGADGMWHLSQ